MHAPASPAPEEAAPYYFKYIDLVPSGQLLELLASQREELAELLRPVGEAAAARRYAADKWSLKQVLAHVNDTERLTVFRALWFARGFESELPSFDQAVCDAAAAADARPLAAHLAEFRAVRDASLAFFGGLGAEAWGRFGRASGCRFSVRALGYLTAGHVTHHLALVRERYLSWSSGRSNASLS